MKKEVMIKAIYEKIADKTLSFGCRIKNLPFENKRTIWVVREVVTLGMFIKKYVSVYAIPEQCKNDGNEECIDFENIEIIGHPVMIGDVLDFFEIKRIEIMQSENYDESVEGPEYGYGPVIHRWKEKRKPIEEQSEDCIKYIYNLIK